MGSSRRRHQYYHYSPRVSRPAYMRWVYIMSGCIVVFVLYVLLSAMMDTHGGAAYTAALCEEYESLRLSGTLCAEVCRDRSVFLYNFVKDEKGYRIFEWGKRLFKVSLKHLEDVAAGNGLHHVYAVPSDGTTIEEFSEMLDEKIVSKLGNIDYEELRNKLLDETDVNKDNKISLGEAKTMWRLLQHEEVFKMLVFSGSEYIERLAGYCGDLYALETLYADSLYTRSDSAVFRTLFPGWHTWWFPEWPVRAQISVGLLEFTLDAYQHGSMGAFHMCSVDERSVGYTRKGDVRIRNVGELVSEQELSDAMAAKPCNDSSMCRYNGHCQTVCDYGRCTTTLVHPDLRHICSLIGEYILKGAPRLMKGDLLHILDKCSQLRHDQDNLDLQHSLILNDLKLLLWKQIQNANI